jgi:ribonucleoside-diphosphate reductase alpha chain
LDWLNTKIGNDIWQQKYRDDSETFDYFLDRVSGGNQKIREHIKNKEFLPAGRILANRGLDHKGTKVTYSNCYVVSAPEDNIESIFECAAKLARTYSYGGGCGISLRNLRPKNSSVNNAAKTTSGATSFMDLYSITTSTICQQGRRGALMISLPVSHPDIIDFIQIKNDVKKVNSANISVEITNDFMEAVVNDKEYTLKFYVNATHECIEKTVKANEIFNLICQSAWKTGEPGVLFWDNICNNNFLNSYKEFKYDGVNPCAR